MLVTSKIIGLYHEWIQWIQWILLNEETKYAVFTLFIPCLVSETVIYKTDISTSNIKNNKFFACFNIFRQNSDIFREYIHQFLKLS